MSPQQEPAVTVLCSQIYVAEYPLLVNQPTIHVRNYVIKYQRLPCDDTQTRTGPATRCPARRPIRLTFRLRMLAALASDRSMTWMSWRVSSPEGRGRVTSSATSFAASSSYEGNNRAVTGILQCTIRAALTTRRCQRARLPAPSVLTSCRCSAGCLYR